MKLEMNEAQLLSDVMEVAASEGSGVHPLPSRACQRRINTSSSSSSLEEEEEEEEEEERARDEAALLLYHPHYHVPPPPTPPPPEITDDGSVGVGVVLVVVFSKKCRYINTPSYSVD